MKKYINIGSMKVPLDSYVTTGTALLGTKGSGKTYTAKGIAEQLLDLKVPIIVFDPIGKWRWLKVPAGRGGRGYKVVVAGGQAPDLPLNPQSATAIVRAAIKENIPLVLDFYDKRLSKADWRKIVQTCFRTLLYENEGLRHIFLEETAEFAPQKVLDGETYAEVEKLVRMGGNASLGITLINQRSQEVNKAVLDLCDNLVLLKQRGAHAIDNLEKWLDRIAPDSAQEIAKELPNLKPGECWVFTADAERPVRTRGDAINSFHPDRTKPEADASARAAADPSDFVKRLSGELDKVIEEAEANDPKRLRTQIAELQRQLREKNSVHAQPPAEVATKIMAAEQRGYEKGMRDAARAAAEGAIKLKKRLKQAVDEAFDGSEQRHLEGPGKIVFAPIPNEWDRPKEVVDSTSILRTRKMTREQVEKEFPGVQISGDRPPVQQRILNTLAELERLDVMRPQKELVAFFANYANVRSKGFANAIGALNSQGLVEYPEPGRVCLTEKGAELAVYPEAPRSPADVQQRVMQLLGGACSRILKPLIESYPITIPRVELAAEAGYENVRSKGFANMLGRLRSLGFVDYDKGSVSANPVLFLQERRQ